MTEREEFQECRSFFCSVSYEKPLKVRIEKPSEERYSPSSASASAWQNGSPPEKVTPSMSSVAHIRSASSVVSMICPGRNAHVAVLKHPWHLVGQPCTHTTARLPGPFATEQLRNPDKFNFIWSTLENRPGPMYNIPAIKCRKVKKPAILFAFKRLETHLL